MKYGHELIAELETEIELIKKTIENRHERIDEGLTDIDDCFMSQRCNERCIANNIDKIALIRDGGCAWFREYATLDNHLVKAKWCNTKFGASLRVEMPNGSIVWTTATTSKGLAKKGIKAVECKRPAWFSFRGNGSGMLGVYSGNYVMFPSDVNYATGEEASVDPVEVIWDIE